MSGENYVEYQPTQSIFDRKEILAPSSYVRVYHETKEEFLAAINREGLRLDTEEKHIGSDEVVQLRNRLFDTFRPRWVEEKGISRVHCLYAYPFLKDGTGMADGASNRFIPQDLEFLRGMFPYLQEHKQDFLASLGVSTVEEYLSKMTDPSYLKSEYPGEVLEVAVDPTTCYVGDLDYITKAGDDVQRGWSQEDAARHEAVSYWDGIVSLHDFLQWYRKPEFTEDGAVQDIHDYHDPEQVFGKSYFLRSGAPDHLSASIHSPEILIPSAIKQEYIRVIQ